MPSFDVDTTEINAFEVEEADLYIFSQYFDQEDVFSELRKWYDSEYYRFEIPADDIDEVEAFLDEYFYELHRVAPDEIGPYCVVKRKYTDHADILRNSVYHTSRGDYNVFVMQDQLSAEQAVERGATPLADADIGFGCDFPVRNQLQMDWLWLPDHRSTGNRGVCDRLDAR